MRLILYVVLVIAVVVLVGDIFSVGDKSRCIQFGCDLNQHVPITFRGERRLYADVCFPRDRDLGTLTLSQQVFAENLVSLFLLWPVLMKFRW